VGEGTAKGDGGVSKYMAGPWRYEDEQVDDDGHYETPMIFSDANPDEPKVVAYLAVRSEMGNNGRLIAAAPEMAEMLLSMFVHVSHGGPTRDEAEELLKKAGVLAV
jgi:hypothetical protein